MGSMAFANIAFDTYLLYWTTSKEGTRVKVIM